MFNVLDYYNEVSVERACEVVGCSREVIEQVNKDMRQLGYGDCVRVLMAKEEYSEEIRNNMVLSEYESGAVYSWYTDEMVTQEDILEEVGI